MYQFGQPHPVCLSDWITIGVIILVVSLAYIVIEFEKVKSWYKWNKELRHVRKVNKRRRKTKIRIVKSDDRPRKKL